MKNIHNWLCLFFVDQVVSCSARLKQENLFLKLTPGEFYSWKWPEHSFLWGVITRCRLGSNLSLWMFASSVFPEVVIYFCSQQILEFNVTVAPDCPGCVWFHHSHLLDAFRNDFDKDSALLLLAFFRRSSLSALITEEGWWAAEIQISAFIWSFYSAKLFLYATDCIFSKTVFKFKQVSSCDSARVELLGFEGFIDDTETFLWL